jgi:hypothetical protein
VAQGVHRGRLGDAGGAHGGVEIALQALLVDVVAMPGVAAARVLAYGRRGKEPEPGPALGRALVLRGEGVRQVDAALLPFLVVEPDAARFPKLQAQGSVERARQHDDAVLAALAVARR